ncbi:MAG TPA: 4Fe-4S dicluster domain-containing protein [Fibrobacteraceae bacterium]|nr:4Fe-4S dicluster domain-containing protein [Fibrobacteraceae bacterium]
MLISKRTFIKSFAALLGGFLFFGCRNQGKKSRSRVRSVSVPEIKGEIKKAMQNQKPLDSLVPIKTPGPLKAFPSEINRFGMAIDLDLCDGCGECILACNLENNIPLVNEYQASKNNYMHWMEMRDQIPVMCFHCGDAPCEKVCPTGAATHSPDGVSAMVFARCAGTRFCGVNCPIKIRKFNYVDALEEGLQYIANPEVPIRERGVIEKCSLCLHRIQNARLKAKTLGVEFRGESLTTACAEACSKGAIQFGNWLDSNSKLYKKAKGRGIYTLASMAPFDPSVVYLKGVR